ncbi:thiamine pyrophosphate-binding protein [Chloroflexota bacterium]
MTRTNRGRRTQTKYGSDIIVDLIKAYGIPYVAFNPGASFCGIHESLVNYNNNTKPEIILCCHEEIAVALAHGYAKATGNPMIAIVHDSVGLQHASMAIYNAWCDQVPLIIIGGNGPMDTTKRRPGADWIHTALVPGNIIRDYVKWDDQPYSIASLPDSFMRAYKIAMTPPKGPAYICCDLGIQEERLSQPLDLPQLTKYSPPPPIPPNQEAIQQVAEWLVNANNPVIVSNYMYRGQNAAELLIKLAEMLAIPVIDTGSNSASVLNHHPLSAGAVDQETLGQADLVLAINTTNLFGHLNIMDRTTGLVRSMISPNTRVVQISMSQLHISSWATDLGGTQAIDLDILADSSLALKQLIHLCQKLISKDVNKRERYKQRYERIRRVHDGLESSWKDLLGRKRNEVPIFVARLCEDVGAVIRDYDWILVNDKIINWPRRLWNWSSPSQFLGSNGGGGLGHGIGSSLGAALAYKDSNKLCVDLQTDGDFLYTNSALWTAAHYKLPLLIVMVNNRCYNQTEEHVERVARERGRPPLQGIGNRLEQPSVNYAQLAQSFGIYAEGPIETPEEIRPALERAIKIVMEDKAPALVDIVTQNRDSILGIRSYRKTESISGIA